MRALFSALPSVNVITAAVMGSLICGWLVVLALACARRLHYLRVHGPNARLRHAAQLLQIHPAEVLARRRAPPLYDEAMATSRPYDEVMERRRAEAEAGDVESGGQSDSGPSPLPSQSLEIVEEVEEEIESDEESLTMTQDGVQWRRNSQPKYTRTVSPDTESLQKSDEEDSSVIDDSQDTAESSVDDCVQEVLAAAEIHHTQGSSQDNDKETDTTSNHQETDNDTGLDTHTSKNTEDTAKDTEDEHMVDIAEDGTNTDEDLLIP